jgi:hypothetical protein
MEYKFSQVLRKAAAKTPFVLLLTLLVSFIAGSRSAFAESSIKISFEGYEIGKSPTGWVSSNGKAQEIYSVRTGDTGKFLHADAQGTSVQIGLEKKWSIQDLPVMEWRWRAIQFPNNTDERKKGTNDSVLGLYILFGSAPFFQAIKYVWSDTLSVGMSFDSPFSSRVRLVVVETGRALAGKWVVERRNVLADYRRLFNARNVPDPTGIAVLTDADNTNSRAVGDYGEIDILPQGTPVKP